MRIGIPGGLLYYKYHPFIESFFYELGCEIVTSGETNKTILDNGVKYCIDDACLPVKIFHGHVVSIKDKCDIVFIPRVMKIYENEFICPKFCGLPEMITNSIPQMPYVTSYPIYAYSVNKLKKWAYNTGRIITKDMIKIEKALKIALNNQQNYRNEIKDKNYKINVALAGHPYNVYDRFINMNLVKKLNRYNIGVITEENLSEDKINMQVSTLYKKPFWTFARKSYGFSTYMAENKLINGIIYVSSFACGIDSVVIDLIKYRIGDFPFLILKIDEHTGEAGFDTRLEAFVDMLERRHQFENYFSSSW